MTQNRRYSEGIEREVEKVVDARERRGTPVSLTVDEVRGTGRRRDIDRSPIAVTAWVRHRVVLDETKLMDADVVAYTDKAVLLRYSDTAGHVQHVWVWAGAVRRR